MTRLKELINRLRQETELPVVNPDRCVHSLLEIASCSACVDACPTRAWALNEEALLFDASACDGCGLCVPVCPESAVTVQYTILTGDLAQEKVVLCACEKTGIEANQGVLPCIQMIGLSEILDLYCRGYLQWVSATGDCSECRRGCGPSLAERVQQVNNALLEEELPVIEYHETGFAHWQRILSRLDENISSSNLDRRAFLKGVVGGGVDTGHALFKQNQQITNLFSPPGKLMPKRNKSTIWPYVPQIDSSRCDGCDACAKTCPHNAISLITESDQDFYIISPEACTECAICQDVCENQAITILKWTRLPKQSLSLSSFTCSRCGNPAHIPSDNHQSLCRVCAKVNHHGNLYQVMN